MSAKVPDGLLFKDEFLLKGPKYGGWILGKTNFLDYLLDALCRDIGRLWDEDEDVQYKGAVLVAPLFILVWDKEDD